MQCGRCGSGAVFFQASSGRYLCSRHLVMDVEARAKRAIRSRRWMHPGDHIAVLLAGDRQSAALLNFLHKLTVDRRDIRLSAVVFEHARGGEDRFQDDRRVAESLGIPCVEIPSPGRTASASGETVTKVAIAISLDDVAQTMTGRFLLGDADQLLDPPPEQWFGIPVICPFITIPSEELGLYGEIEGQKAGIPGLLPARDTLPQDIADLLREYYCNHPGTQYALLHLAEQLSGGRVAGTVIPRFTGKVKQ
ncbi:MULTISPECIES: hypothetical protein [unclassified Methanoregula]|uniref:hypothetical protein n=1 Tax=unclassified Methanoregula TaxID=2649730 RepID=UPI0009C61463|nr:MULTISPECIES: hypothetical protein [unclassified Methanoregula]OPX64175.1 MAG: hypothetical protein A4E33_01202 [Methanoregula sp. PtaB.Bin085]OPY34705.1 MAG: hypothetical protein A4E34_01231 [Methanoregula sp. PtaU1.Bin006]